MSCRAVEALEPGTLRLLQLAATTLSRGRDFDAGANNWVGSGRDPSDIATYRGITSAGCLRSFPPPKPAIHKIIASWHARGFAGRPTTSGEPFDPPSTRCSVH
jgi:rare lipoprotein A (peptidoglycan hydrolase)